MRWWPRSRTPRPAAPPGAELRDAVRRAIGRTRSQQAELTARAGAVFVQRAEVERALADQHGSLLASVEQISQAIAVADAAAAAARSEPGQDLAPYTRTVEGLQVQLDVVRGSLAQLEQLRAGAQENLADAQALLRANAATLDRALRAEVQLLGRLDRLERSRVIAEATARLRADRAERPDPGPADR